MATHNLKTWPPFFRAIFDGRKTFEVRHDDRGFDVGDTLVLNEFEPQTGYCTGRDITVEVTYVMRGGDFGVERGYVVMGIRKHEDRK